MLKRFGLIFTLCALLFGCASKGNYETTTRFHDDGRAKPSVAFTPVFDRSEANVGWSLSEEFTDQLRSRLVKRKNFYLTSPFEISEIVSGLNRENNPFGKEINWIKETFKGQEFVVFTELVEHDIHGKTPKGNFIDKITPSSELTLTMRIRVFDLRGTKPVVILQEFVHQDHLIPRPSNISDPNPEKWKRVTFTVSPLGIAHSQFAKEVAKRIEDYILLSKTQ